MAYKHDYDKILARLIYILSRLHDGEALSVKELAKEFNISERTVQRDFNERLSSFPIYQEQKKWKMQKGYKLEKVQSIEDEIVLDILEKITEGIGGRFSIKAHKLLSKIKNEDFNPIYAKLNIEDISDLFKDLEILESAIKEQKEIECYYDNEKSPLYKTTLQPLKIANYEGFWYLIALQKGDLKKYYLKNISHPVLSDKSFKKDLDLDRLLKNSLSIWFRRSVEPYEVKLFATKLATKYFKRRPLPTQKRLSQFEDGTMEFSVEITHEMEILPIIKYWIPHLFIIEPVWLKEKLAQDLKLYEKQVKNY